MLILDGAVETNDLSAVPEPKVFAENPMPILYAKTLNDTVKNGAGDFFKFLFVRHPFERLVSAYQDKLARNNDPIYHKVVSKVIVGKVRKNPSPLEMGDDVDFPRIRHFHHRRVERRQETAGRPLAADLRPLPSV
jgi:chondroitin 4-sulfotransferase 11